MTPLDRLKVLPKELCVLAVKAYQRFISPCFPARCRYYPSCSEYTVQAVRKHGAVKGIIMGTWRILRCNPFSKGGVDFVPEKFELPGTIVFRGQKR